MKCKDFIAQHTDIHYCEAVIAPNGDIDYALPGHVYKLIRVADESQEELDTIIPMRAAPLEWLVEHTSYGVIWYNMFILPEKYTNEQIQSLQSLCDANIINSDITGYTSSEKTNCDILAKFDQSGDEKLFDTLHKKKLIRITRSDTK